MMKQIQLIMDSEKVMTNLPTDNKTLSFWLGRKETSEWIGSTKSKPIYKLVRNYKRLYSIEDYHLNIRYWK
jgi:hypothetical protein